jgi:hypothetical protein
MKIWAISDLHLGFSTGKWMDRFGEHWRDHHVRVEARWRDRVGASDLVLVPGDLSWAMTIEEAAADLQWLGRLPGRKLLIKGNHDYWWPKTKKRMQDALPPGVIAIKRNAVLVDGVPFVGVRGCDFFPRPDKNDEEDIAGELEREIHEFELSVDALKKLGPPSFPPIALFHYPPFPVGSCESRFTQIAEEAGCRQAVYGHLHTQSEWGRHFQGEFRGVNYRLVSCDYLDFTPILIAVLP